MEIAKWKYITMDELDAQFQKSPQDFTPWFKMEWQELRTKYIDKILSL
jgi:isopentenyl-diphosphate delta-isomerase